MMLGKNGENAQLCKEVILILYEFMQSSLLKQTFHPFKMSEYISKQTEIFQIVSPHP